MPDHWFTINVECDGVPAAGALLTVGEDGNKEEADENGQVKFGTTSDSSIVAMLVIENTSAGKRISGPLHLEADQEYTIDVFPKSE